MCKAYFNTMIAINPYDEYTRCVIVMVHLTLKPGGSGRAFHVQDRVPGKHKKDYVTLERSIEHRDVRIRYPGTLARHFLSLSLRFSPRPYPSCVARSRFFAIARARRPERTRAHRREKGHPRPEKCSLP